MIEGRLPHQRQSQPHSFGLGGDERFEEDIGHLAGGTRSCVANFDPNQPVIADCPQRHLSAGTSRLDGIRDEIEDGGSQALDVGMDLIRRDAVVVRFTRRVERDESVFANRLDECRHVGDDLVPGRTVAGWRRSPRPRDNSPRTCVSVSAS